MSVVCQQNMIMIKKVNISDIDLTDLEQSLLIEFIDHLDQFEPGYSDLSGNEVADFAEPEAASEVSFLAFCISDIYLPL